jgi:3-oxoacyl-[acyl-carrier protein] reductase
LAEGVALVTGGGRGIGASIARALAGDGWDVVVTARSRDQIESVAREVGGRALELDVSAPDAVARAFDEIGTVDLLVANAGRAPVSAEPSWEQPLEDWWQTFEVNVLGVHLCCREAIGRGVARIVITSSGSSYLPGSTTTAYSASKAAAGRYAETLHNELGGRIPVFFFSPGLVQTELTKWAPADAPWTPPELAPELVRKLATGAYDVLAGRYLHAEHDDLDDLLARADEIRERDLNAIRLQR